MKEEVERCLQDDCLAYLMASRCKETDCRGLKDKCGFDKLCPFNVKDRAIMTAMQTPITVLTNVWRKAIVENRSRLYAAGIEQGRKKAYLKSKEESNG